MYSCGGSMSSTAAASRTSLCTWGSCFGPTRTDVLICSSTSICSATGVTRDFVIWLRPGIVWSSCVFCWSSGCRKSLARTLLRLARAGGAGGAGGFGVVGSLASLADFDAASSPTGKGRASAARRARRRAGGADLATACASRAAECGDDDDDDDDARLGGDDGGGASDAEEESGGPDGARDARREQRKAAKKAAKAEKRAKRGGGDGIDAEGGRVDDGRKACDGCGARVDLLIRCQTDASRAWTMRCGKCWKVASGGVPDGDADHPHYRYGGLWKNRRAVRRVSTAVPDLDLDAASLRVK
mmetsp:Transcript_12773/g.51348  ORF Transcript_12773/g.51348 Transcript_12773/m.51348 type:complete len:300 (-) Transcript_12773:270-1169(-)